MSWVVVSVAGVSFASSLYAMEEQKKQVAAANKKAEEEQAKINQEQENQKQKNQAAETRDSALKQLRATQNKGQGKQSTILASNPAAIGALSGKTMLGE